jgi:hypothetical protein
MQEVTALQGFLAGVGRRGLSSRATVDQTITNVAADRRINKFFAHADIPHLRRSLADQICAASGGWCTYWGRDMKPHTPECTSTAGTSMPWCRISAWH